MKFSYHFLQSFFNKKLPKPEKLAEILTMHSFEVEGLEKKDGDWLLDIDVLPNRAPDCFSHLGVAREIAALLNYKLQKTKDKLQENKKLKTKDFVKVEVKSKKNCPRYTARIITEVKVGSSPKWLQNRLKICGIRPINNIVDIANYVMLETGQPLHTFDLDKISGRKIIVRKAKKNEKITTLDGENYNLNENVLVISDLKRPLAVAGIKGGKGAEISKLTKNIVLESANFNQVVIRRASQKINLRTDASLRFEHGIDLNLTDFAINRAAYLIQEIAKGKIAQGLIDFYPRKVLPPKIKLDLNYLESLLGMKIPEKETTRILKSLGFQVKKNGREQFSTTIPTFRLDIKIPEDLIEEIGRIYGYQKIPPVFPKVALIPPQRNLNIFWQNMVRDILKEAGFTEVYNYSFISKKEADILNFKDLIEVENPISVEYQYLRPSLIPNLLKNVQRNQKFFKEMRIFELAKVFKPGKNKEKTMLSGAVIGDNFYYLKGAIDSLLSKLGISNYWYDEYKATPEESKKALWQPKKSAEIKTDHTEIGFLGEISPKIIEDLKLESKVVIFDIDFEKLEKVASEEHEFRPISSYPAAIRDIAILVPRDVKVDDVLNKIDEVSTEIVRDVDLFDIYEGEELPEGKKNLAFHIIYQAEDRTLKSEEIDKIHQKIIEALEKNPDWEVRR